MTTTICSYIHRQRDIPMGDKMFVSRGRRFPVALAAVFLSTVATFGARQQASPVGAGQSDTTAAHAVVERYCAGCHNDKVKSGDLSLTTANVENPGASPEIWEKVVRKLRGRMMPPPGRPRPD